jgi:hypothetical protein
MTALLHPAPPPAPHAPPVIHVSRGGMRYPHDYGGKMDDAWHAAWQALADHEWHDAAPLAVWIAEQAGIEVDSARGMLRQAVRHGVLTVRHRLRGEPRRWRAEYRVRPSTAEIYERRAAGLIERFLRTRGRRAGFQPAVDLPALREWLRNVGQDSNWRRCRDGAGVDTDADLLAAIRRIRPRLVGVDSPAAAQSAADAEVSAAQTSPEVSATDSSDRTTTEALLVRDPAKPTPAELTNIRLRALDVIAAVVRDDWAAVHHLRPRTAVDGGYLSTGLAELVIHAVRASGQPLGAWVQETRTATVRAQANGGRS